MKTKLTVYWVTNDPELKYRIRKRFGIPRYTNINGESPAEISDEDMPVLVETAKRGYIQIRQKKWCKNGEQYIFISR